MANATCCCFIIGLMAIMQSTSSTPVVSATTVEPEEVTVETVETYSHRHRQHHHNPSLHLATEPPQSATAVLQQPGGVSAPRRSKNTSGAPFRLRAFSGSRGATAGSDDSRPIISVIPSDLTNVSNPGDFRFVRVPVKILPAVLRYIEEQKRRLGLFD